MTTVEKKLLDFIEKHLDVMVTGVLTVLSILIRFGLRNLISVDADVFLLPWYEEIRGGGGMKALGEQVGNYNILYQTLIALFTYLPVKPLYAYKLLSVFFDYCLAVTVGCLVYQHSDGERKWKGILAYTAVILSPIVILNSSAWGQCDSIYVCFVLLALTMLCREKYVPAFLLLGAAFSFKLQAVFVLPFFLFVYFWRKRFSVLYFLMVPVVMCVLNLAGVIMGRSFWDIFKIYLDQTSDRLVIVKNYPSVWLLLAKNDNPEFYWHLKKPAILFTVAVLVLLMTFLILKRVKWNTRNLIYIAFLLSYTCVLFLPTMHERYGYLYEILAIIVLIWKRKTAALIIPMYCMTILTYSHFLFETDTSASVTMAVVNLIVYLGYAFLLLKEMTGEQRKGTA